MVSFTIIAKFCFTYLVLQETATVGLPTADQLKQLEDSGFIEQAKVILYLFILAYNHDFSYHIIFV